MKKITSMLLFAFLLIVATLETTYAQSDCIAFREAKLVVSEAGGGGRDTLRFGVDPLAIPCYDITSVCNVEFPPFPPVGVFEARFVRWCLPPWPDSIWLRYMKRDIRQYYSPTQIDTYKVKFQPGGGSYPMHFTWNSTEVARMCDSAIIIDPFGFGPPIGFKARMDQVESVDVVSVFFTQAIIYRYGAIPLVDVPLGSGNGPTQFALAQNYPNPFNPSTNISYQLGRKSHVTLKIFDLLGREVATLVDKLQDAGYNSLEWNATTGPGTLAGSGVYFYRLTANGQTLTRKMLLTR